MTDTVNVPREAIEAAAKRYPDGAIEGGFVTAIQTHKRQAFVAGYQAAMLAAAPKAEPVSDPYKSEGLVAELRQAACGIFVLKNERGDYGYFDTLADRIEVALNSAQPLSNPQELAEPVAGEPVAWTHDVQMNKLRNAPKEASAMWGQPNGSINLPLYTHPDPKLAVAEKALEEVFESAENGATYIQHVALTALAQIKGANP